jgi:hypothetical protein
MKDQENVQSNTAALGEQYIVNTAMYTMLQIMICVKYERKHPKTIRGADISAKSCTLTGATGTHRGLEAVKRAILLIHEDMRPSTSSL